MSSENWFETSTVLLFSNFNPINRLKLVKCWTVAGLRRLLGTGGIKRSGCPRASICESVVTFYLVIEWRYFMTRSTVTHTRFTWQWRQWECHWVKGQRSRSTSDSHGNLVNAIGSWTTEGTRAKTRTCIFYFLLNWLRLQGYTVSQKKTPPMFLAVTHESIVEFL